MPSLRDLRTTAGLTQGDLAKVSGLRQATISALENGRSTAHSGTVLALAAALETDPDSIRAALNCSRAPKGLATDDGTIAQMGADWPFLDGLDVDLRAGLVQSLVSEWTHSSTALEGNTISASDTLFVLTEGLTVSGVSLREHQELHGHAQALGLMAAWTRVRQPVRIEHLHQLHRAVQTGVVIDAFAPVGRWKVEPNGTTAITTSRTTDWHDYAKPSHVAALVDGWLKSLARACRNPLLKDRGRTGDPKAREASLDAYTNAHLGFVGIHPYADGNGRMARLLANIPILRAGLPPLLVRVAQRRNYIALLGDYSLSRGQVQPGEDLVCSGAEREALRAFFAEEWQGTMQFVAEFHQRQSSR
jgi:transcriptional regulator with XRE-family HTH domain/fido (protein-threonine AMPylation protein)